jgi:two-component system, sporulation sensor kinase C
MGSSQELCLEMKPTCFSELEDGLQSIFDPGQNDIVSGRSGVGLLIDDPVNQRLVEAASIQLELVPVNLSKHLLKRDALSEFELIVADEAVARKIRSAFSKREEHGAGINPAVIAILPREVESQPALGELDPLERGFKSNGNGNGNANSGFDGVLHLPMGPAPLAAQLSVILYAHRAFAERYHSALEELNLNRRIFRSVTSGISVANATLPDLPLVYVNPAFEVMTGYTLEEVQGKNCRFLQRTDHDQPALTLIREAIRNRRETLAILKNYRKDGTPFWNELSLSPIRNRNGEVTHFVGIQTDVTSRIEFEAALRESEKLAAVGRLASSIAHEINNPLSSVMNLLYLAQSSDEMAKVQDYLATADKELQRVKLITSQSLRFYKQSTKPQAIKCSELLDSVLDIHQTRFLNAQVTIERRERSTQSIVCMESEIRQVLNNLIANAIDALHGKGGRILIGSREATEWKSGAHGVLMTIADTGSGIDPEIRKQMYRAFFTTKGLGGTGLGLWISSEIVERHHGRLMVRSSQREKKSGTVFDLFLPYQGIAS